MAAPKGSKFWEARSTHGRQPIFKSPEALWAACVEYFQWVEDNPLWESKLASDKGEQKVFTLPKLRAMTISSLCLFIDICEKTWANYRNRENFLQVVTRVEKIIYDQKFTGASADLLNANIIARDLGLKDEKKVDWNDITKRSDAELRLRAAQLLAALGTSGNAGGTGPEEED